MSETGKEPGLWRKFLISHIRYAILGHIKPIFCFTVVEVFHKNSQYKKELSTLKLVSSLKANLVVEYTNFIYDNL